MSMYGRVQPDALGRPARIWVNQHAATVMGAGPWKVEVQGERLVLRRDPAGLRMAEKTRTISAGAILDQLNTDGALTNEPFPVRRLRDGEFECLVREPDPALSARGNSRAQAMPMTMVERGVMQRQQHNTAEFVQLFALLELARGEPLKPEHYAAPDDLLARMPGHSTILARFGTWARFEGFVAFQRRRLERQYPKPDLAHDRLLELL